MWSKPVKSFLLKIQIIGQKFSATGIGKSFYAQVWYENQINFVWNVRSFYKCQAHKCTTLTTSSACTCCLMTARPQAIVFVGKLLSVSFVLYKNVSNFSEKKIIFELEFTWKGSGPPGFSITSGGRWIFLGGGIVISIKFGSFFCSSAKENNFVLFSPFPVKSSRSGARSYLVFAA